MTIDRLYRKGMAPERARAILREHAGSHWDERFVNVLVELTLENDRVAATPRLDRVGLADEPAGHPIGCGCLPALVRAG